VLLPPTAHPKEVEGTAMLLRLHDTGEETDDHKKPLK
jgi:hypothetical protein